MFSLLGVLFGMELPEVLAPLSMNEALQEALLEDKGELALALHLCEAVEEGDFGAVATHLQQLAISVEDFNNAMIDANLWMIGAVRGTGMP
jgi:c-di-GMP-related signal transduction protein